MRHTDPSPRLLSTLLFVTIALLSMTGEWTAVGVAAQDAPPVKIPQPGVPQIMTLEGAFVRAAYNNEGYAIVGYKLANNSLGEDWMLLEFGVTVRDGVANYTMTRDALSLEIPGGKRVALASEQEYRHANLSALENRQRVIRDSINYFPPSANQACRLGFFAEIDSPAMAWDQVELSNRRACLGRLYFQIPGGIQYGQYWLDVKFEKSLVRVPFRVFTKEEEQLVSRNFGDIRKQVQDAFKPKKEK
jgi:hypothetical protein